MLFSIVFLTLLISSSHSREIIIDHKLSDWQTFHLDEETPAFLLHIESNFQGRIIVSDLISPSGEIYLRSNINTYNENLMDPSFYSNMYSSTRVTSILDGLSSAFVTPLTSTHIEKGLWKFRVGIIYPGAQRDTKVKIGLKIVDSQTTPLNFFLDIDETIYTDENKDRYDSIISNIVSFYENNGIDLAFTIRKKSFSFSPEQEGDLVAMLNHLQKRKSEYSTISLISNNIEHSDTEHANHHHHQKELQGITGCFGGFQPESIERHCGIAISIKESNELAPNRITRIIAHEIAHHFAIPHIVDEVFTINRFTVYDEFEDTPLNDWPGNLMYRGNDTDENFSLSPEQRIKAQTYFKTTKSVEI